MIADTDYNNRREQLFRHQKILLDRQNVPETETFNGVFLRYRHPIVTADHIPLHWRYDLNRDSNPFLMERMGVNSTFNCGAIELGDRIVLVVRIEGYDRKSFFGLAESTTGVDGFRFHDKPLVIPELDDTEINHYDMRLVHHEDGWIYGIFCVERENRTDGSESISNATAQCGIVRTHDLNTWERLADVKTPSLQQRNVVLHPQFIDGGYAFYTRPQDHFMYAGSGGGIAFGLSQEIESVNIIEERLIDPRQFHTIKETKNGAGAAPIKTNAGWLHIAHGVRECSAGMRYVLYAFICELEKPWMIKYSPGGYLMAPQAEERVGDVSNVLFTNGLIHQKNGRILIYYASSDTRCHVAESTVDRLVDYCKNTPQDPLRSHLCAKQREHLAEKNLLLKQ